MAGENPNEIDDIKKRARLILKNEIDQLLLVPSIASKLLTLTSDDQTRIEDLIRLIETEPALVAKILQNVNSAAYALPNQISSIHRAVNLLGFSAVRRIALALIFYNRLINHHGSQIFDPLFFWQHCLFVASLSRRIALALGHQDADTVYTAGLLHDIGKVVLESHGRLTYSDFISSLGTRRNSTIEEEHVFFGITHTEIGHLLCLEWQLPAPIAAVVAHHHDQTATTSLYAEFNREIAIVSFANYIAWMHGIVSSTIESQPKITQNMLEVINVDKLDLEKLLQQVDKEMLSTREFFGIQFPDIGKLRATLVQTSITLCQLAIENGQPGIQKTDRHIPSSLTMPHQSLDPDEFIPSTLEAMQRDFAFDQVIMFTIDPVRRSLIPTYRHSESRGTDSRLSIEININAMSGLFLNALRTKKPVIITDKIDSGNPILRHLHVNEFIAVPVFQQSRLVGVIYADYSVTKKNIPRQLLTDIIPIAHQLGIALVNANQYETEKKQAQLDPLTQILNKRMIDQSLAKIFQLEPSKLERFAIGFVDIDKFKLFNDFCGHQAGDEIIQFVAAILQRLTRPGDIIGRYGGEEFLFALNNTNKAGALAYAERIRSEIERHGAIISPRFNYLPLTVSIGISIYHPGFSNYTDMIEVADQAMYRAKNEGRNRVILLTDITSPSTCL